MRLGTLPILIPLLTLSAIARAEYITLTFSGNETAHDRTIFTAAAAYWNNAITGFKANFESDGTPAGERHLAISADVTAIDGPSGTLGSAGPNDYAYYDNNPLGAPTYARQYATAGAMRFDSADVGGMSDTRYYSVVLHEMGHVLGIGTLWQANSVSTYGAVGNPMYDPTSADLGTMGGENVGKYTGRFALAGWNAEFGRADTFVPVEKGGGSGTEDAHWNEGDLGLATGILSTATGLDFSRELMTGWANDPMFVSRATLGSLEDLGFDVDYSRTGLVTYTPVPEPASCGLIGAGLVGAVAMRRRRRAA